MGTGAKGRSFQSMTGAAHWGLEPWRLCNHVWRCYLKQRKPKIWLLSSPAFFIAQAPRYQLILELGKCSVALKGSPSVLAQSGRRVSHGLREHSARTRSSVEMVLWTDGHPDSYSLVFVCSLWGPWNPGVQIQQRTW